MLNGLSYGLLLFMLSSGLTLIFSMMGVLNFAHASFYMVGAYVAYSITRIVGFWPGLFFAPFVVAALGAAFEKYCLRRVHKFGHVPELLITFGLSYVMLELVQLIWGRTAVDFQPPEVLRGPAFTLINSSVDGLRFVWGAAPAAMCSAADAAVRIVCSPFPATRGFMMLIALIMLVALWLMLTRTRELNGNLDGDQKPLAAVASLALLGAFIAAIVKTDWPRDVGQITTVPFNSIGIELFNRWAVPFEIASGVLLVALVGAIIIAMQEESER